MRTLNTGDLLAIILERLRRLGVLRKLVQPRAVALLDGILSLLCKKKRIALREISLTQRHHSANTLNLLLQLLQNASHQILRFEIYFSEHGSVASHSGLLEAADLPRLESFKAGMPLPNKEYSVDVIVSKIRSGWNSRNLRQLNLHVEMGIADTNALFLAIAECTGHLEHLELTWAIGIAAPDAIQGVGSEGEYLAPALKANAATLKSVTIDVGSAHREIIFALLHRDTVEKLIRDRDFKGLEDQCQQKLGLRLSVFQSRLGSVWSLFTSHALFAETAHPPNIEEFAGLFELCQDSERPSFDCWGILRELNDAGVAQDRAERIRGWIAQTSLKLLQHIEKSSPHNFNPNLVVSLVGLIFDNAPASTGLIDQAMEIIKRLIRINLNVSSRLVAPLLFSPQSSHESPLFQLFLKRNELLENGIKIDINVDDCDSFLPIEFGTLSPTALLHLIELPEFNALHLDHRGFNLLEFRMVEDSRDSSDFAEPFLAYCRKFIAQSGGSINALFALPVRTCCRMMSQPSIAHAWRTLLREHGIDSAAFLKLPVGLKLSAAVLSPADLQKFQTFASSLDNRPSEAP